MLNVAIFMLVGLSCFFLGIFIGALLIQIAESKKREKLEKENKDMLALKFAEAYQLAQQQAAFIEKQCADIKELQTMLDMRAARRN
jgi:mannitol-specific phosphotransferase system IIBC component